MSSMTDEQIVEVVARAKTRLAKVHDYAGPPELAPDGWDIVEELLEVFDTAGLSVAPREEWGSALAQVQSTQAMRDRARELAKGGDDYDRVFMTVLDDLERFVPSAYPTDVTQAEHIAHDMRMGRFPKQSAIADFLVERAARSLPTPPSQGGEDAASPCATAAEEPKA